MLRAEERIGPYTLIRQLGQGSFGVVWLASRLLTRSPVVHVDGPLSVRAAFTPAELLALTHAGGLTGATVTPRFPGRMILEWRAAA